MSIESRISRVLTMVIAIGFVAAIVVATGKLIGCCMARGGEAPHYVVADWVWVLLQFGLAGALGGFLTYLGQYYVDGDESSENGDPDSDPNSKPTADGPPAPPPGAWMVFVHCMGGVGGAYAVLFIQAQSAMMSELKMDNAVILKNVVTGFVAGFLGFPLLKRVAKSAEGALGAVNKLDKKRRRDQKENQHRYELNAALQVASDEYMKWRIWKVEHKGASPPTVYEPGAGFTDAMKRLEDARKMFPYDRNAAMKLSNMHYILATSMGDVRATEHQKAVDVLTSAINAIEKRRTAENAVDSDRNLSDLLFNRACNNSRLRDCALDPEKPAMKRKVLDDLTRCFQLNPLNRQAAQKERDGDFDGLIKDKDAEFQALVGQ